jgi:hypothetical protein
MGKNNKKPDIQELRDFATAKGGKLISDQYINNSTKYLWEDHLGNQWYASWGAVRHKTWSPFLVKEKQRTSNLKFTIEDLQKFAESKGGKCLSTVYTKGKDKFLWEDEFGNQFKKSWVSIYKQGEWSPLEKRKNISKAKTKWTYEQLKDTIESAGYELISITQANNLTKRVVNIKHKETGAVRRVEPSYGMKYGFKIYYGKQQAEIAKFIESLGVKVEQNIRTIIAPKELDILLTDLNIAIELDGLYWHNKDKQYHLNKTIEARKKGIQLLHFFDIEWQTRKEQIKSFLTAKLNKNHQRVYARKCNIQIVDKSIARDFLNKYHIQGTTRFEKAYGLYLNGELLSLITIGRHHRNTKADTYVLSRYIVKSGVSVLGGLSRLTKSALKDYGKLITWVDLRISDGSNWIKSGWTLEAELPPDYFYYDRGARQIVSKQSRKKKTVNTPKGMTELEHAKKDGLTRIYDCGKLRLAI